MNTEVMLMICPYNRAKSIQIMQYRNDLVDEEGGIVKGYDRVVIDGFVMMECPEEGCAVWRDGKCCYQNR